MILALAAEGRFNAMRNVNTNTNAATDRMFVLTSAFIVFLLTILFMLVTYNRAQQERKISKQLFQECAEKISLTNQQLQLLLDITTSVGMKRIDSIFTRNEAFDKGAAKITEENLSQQGSQENEKLRAELSELRQKLGFQKRQIASVGQIEKSKKLSTRQIPVNKKLHITPAQTTNLPSIEATIIHNSDTELTVKLQMPVETSTGDIWQVKYYFGSSVWEFDTSVVSCSETTLVLNHCDNVRFMNLRRFFTAKVNKPAFVARFPFEKTLIKDVYALEESANTDNWAMLKFSPAVVTELSGPNLRIETKMQIKTHDRILLFLNLDEQTTYHHKQEEQEEQEEQEDQEEQPTMTITTKIIQDIAEVKKVESTSNGFAMEIELTGLSDKDINELICAANIASTKEHAEKAAATTG